MTDLSIIVDYLDAEPFPGLDAVVSFRAAVSYRSRDDWDIDRIDIRKKCGSWQPITWDASHHQRQLGEALETYAYMQFEPIEEAGEEALAEALSERFLMAAE